MLSWHAIQITKSYTYNIGKTLLKHNSIVYIDDSELVKKVNMKMALIIKMSCSGADSSTGKNDCMIIN